MIKAMNMPQLADDSPLQHAAERRENNEMLKQLSRHGSRAVFQAAMQPMGAEAERVRARPILTLKRGQGRIRICAGGTVGGV